MSPTIVKLPFVVGPPPADWKPTTEEKVKVTAPSTKLSVYPAGPSFIAAARRQHLDLSWEDDDKIQADLLHQKLQAKAIEAGEELYPGLGEEQEERHVLAYDPKEWKKQDHYAVLGLGNLRYLATEDHIRVAHRRKVLRHHPDKKAGSSAGPNDDSFFKCIAKAFEVLLNPETRRQFDSIDPAIEDHVPNAKDVSAEDFIASYGPVFAREARFSKTQPVPTLGEMDAKKEDVEKFYDFWYNFDSWRTFEMWDKEVNEGSDSRDEKRYQEKKNKAERARAKKEDNTRVREMVDMILAADPRIKRFRQEEKAARDAKKKATGKPGQAGGKPLTLAQRKAAEQAKLEELQKEQEANKAKEAEDKVQREQAKKAREAAKKNLKKWKKAITTIVAESNYFQASGSPSASTIEKQLAEIDALVEILEPEQTKELKESVEKAGKGDAAKEAIKAKVATVADKEEAKGKFTEFA